VPATANLLIIKLLAFEILSSDGLSLLLLLLRDVVSERRRRLSLATLVLRKTHAGLGDACGVALH